MYPIQTGGHTDKEMKEYTRKHEGNDICRRFCLYSDYPQSMNRPTSLCVCCDICSLKCECGQCVKLNQIM